MAKLKVRLFVDCPTDILETVLEIADADLVGLSPSDREGYFQDVLDDWIDNCIGKFINSSFEEVELEHD